MSNDIATQIKKVHAAYATTGSVNPDYELEFELLSNMRADEQAKFYRQNRGLPDDAQTPYDR